MTKDTDNQQVELDTDVNCLEVGRWILFHKPRLFREILLHDE